MITSALGFLFSRWTFLILAVVVVAILVNAGKLLWNRYTIGGLVLLALCFGAWTWHDKKVEADRVATAAPYIKLIDDNNKAAEKKLAEETDRVNATSKQLTLALAVQEKNDASNLQTITTFNASHRTTRLSDPGNQTRCGGGGPKNPSPASASNSAADTGQGSGLLSVEASDFLWDFAFEADRINEAYRSCRAYAQTVRDKLAVADAEPLVLAMSAWPK